MKLRNFLYLNTKVIDDYISAIDGYTYDEESQSIANKSENKVEGSGKLFVASGKGTHSGEYEEKINRSVRISDSAKFEKIYQYLKNDDYNNLKYYEVITDSDYNMLERDDFIEVLVNSRFSKMKKLTDSVSRLAEFASALENRTDKKILNKEVNDAVNGFSTLGLIKSNKEIACVFEFTDGKYPLVSYLNENNFKCNQYNFIGEAYLLCKIIRKLPKGKSIKLDEIFEDFKKLPLNRKQRRNMPQNMDNPSELRDVIKGPAFVVLPIAVYQ